ncbi:MAG: AraC family transcriptional regulator, partial [Actinobacteria bacterium]|nr:AraC family transcriptional regulator [Actinomycetota bacterium]
EEIFGAPLSFGADVSAMRLSPETLHLPPMHPDPSVLTILDPLLQDSSARLRKESLVVDEARRVVPALLPDGVPTLRRIAARLQRSEAEVAAALEEAGTSPRELVDSVRRALAERYLQDPARPISEISFVLGFSGAAVFHRAFKRWTGTTPAGWRARARP